jgi:pilus assembly protein Flp/PilA
MKDIALKATTNAKVRVNGWANTTVEAITRRGDKGQTAVEYIGMLIAIIAIIAVVASMTDIGNTIGDKIRETVESIG